jgi:hypothetical protein
MCRGWRRWAGGPRGAVKTQFGRGRHADIRQAEIHRAGRQAQAAQLHPLAGGAQRPDLGTALAQQAATVVADHHRGALRLDGWRGRHGQDDRQRGQQAPGMADPCPPPPPPPPAGGVRQGAFRDSLSGVRVRVRDRAHRGLKSGQESGTTLTERWVGGSICAKDDLTSPLIFGKSCRFRLHLLADRVGRTSCCGGAATIRIYCCLRRARIGPARSRLFTCS